MAEKKDARVILEFDSEAAAKHFIGWFLDGGGDDRLVESAEIHLKDESATPAVVEYDGVRWPEQGFDW